MTSKLPALSVDPETKGHILVLGSTVLLSQTDFYYYSSVVEKKAMEEHQTETALPSILVAFS